MFALFPHFSRGGDFTFFLNAFYPQALLEEYFEAEELIIETLDVTDAVGLFGIHDSLPTLAKTLLRSSQNKGLTIKTSDKLVNTLNIRRRMAENNKQVQDVEEEKKMKFRDFIGELQGNKNLKLYLML